MIRKTKFLAKATIFMVAISLVLTGCNKPVQKETSQAASNVPSATTKFNPKGTFPIIKEKTKHNPLELQQTA